MMTGDEYRRTAKALARETRMGASEAARIEQHLLSAMSGRRSASTISQRFGLRVERKWLAAAAAVAVIAGSVVLWRVAGGPVAIKSTEQVNFAQPSTRQDIVLPAPAKTFDVAAANVSMPRPNRAARRTRTARVVTPSGFVELPLAAGLPAFESGEIVRLELPVASLPTYGIDISSGTGSKPVEADVLIGQDGFARAIRLVTNDARSTQ